MRTTCCQGIPEGARTRLAVALLLSLLFDLSNSGCDLIQDKRRPIKCEDTIDGGISRRFLDRSTEETHLILSSSFVSAFHVHQPSLRELH